MDQKPAAGRSRRSREAADADVWALRIAAIVAASATIYFVALAILTGPAHGPFIEIVVAGAALTVALLIGAQRLQKRPPAPKGPAESSGQNALRIPDP